MAMNERLFILTYEFINTLAKLNISPSFNQTLNTSLMCVKMLESFNSSILINHLRNLLSPFVRQIRTRDIHYFQSDEFRKTLKTQLDNTVISIFGIMLSSYLVLPIIEYNLSIDSFSENIHIYNTLDARIQNYIWQYIDSISFELL